MLWTRYARAYAPYTLHAGHIGVEHPRRFIVTDRTPPQVREACSDAGTGMQARQPPHRMHDSASFPGALLLYLTLSSCWDTHLTLIVKDVVLSTALKALKSSSRSPGTHWHEYFVPSTPMPQTHECRFVP